MRPRNFTTSTLYLFATNEQVLDLEELDASKEDLDIWHHYHLCSLPPSSKTFIAFSHHRYMLATNVIGFAYTLLQIVFSNFHITMGNHLISGDGGVLLGFYFFF
ncbi:hypothetical protein CMV_017612 [Castanea mollissima]|uniref:Uncharacterized protein n=1 Tax=Castanea mollissima TaxID=60419 RepID=A0A8J4VQH0_9ROSI|nr:hypothetical protein CMV_017612 [Castanea mollissima]